MKRNNHRRRWSWWLIGTLAVLALVLGTWGGACDQAPPMRTWPNQRPPLPRKPRRKLPIRKRKGAPTVPKRRIPSLRIRVRRQQPIPKGTRGPLLIVLTIRQLVLSPRPLLIRGQRTATLRTRPIMICPTMTLPARPPEPRWAPSSITWWLSSTSWPASTRNTRTLPPSTAASPAFRRAIIS